MWSSIQLDISDFLHSPRSLKLFMQSVIYTPWDPCGLLCNLWSYSLRSMVFLWNVWSKHVIYLLFYAIFDLYKDFCGLLCSLWSKIYVDFFAVFDLLSLRSMWFSMQTVIYTAKIQLVFYAICDLHSLRSKWSSSQSDIYVVFYAICDLHKFKIYEIYAICDLYSLTSLWTSTQAVIYTV